MTAPATYTVAPTFLGIERRDRAAAISIAGIPFDIGTSNRSGARFGPAAIRLASRMLVDGAHPVHWIDPAALPLAATACTNLPTTRYASRKATPRDTKRSARSVRLASSGLTRPAHAARGVRGDLCRRRAIKRPIRPLSLAIRQADYISGAMQRREI